MQEIQLPFASDGQLSTPSWLLKGDIVFLSNISVNLIPSHFLRGPWSIDSPSLYSIYGFFISLCWPLGIETYAIIFHIKILFCPIYSPWYVFIYIFLMHLHISHLRDMWQNFGTSTLLYPKITFIFLLNCPFCKDQNKPSSSSWGSKQHMPWREVCFSLGLTPWPSNIGLFRASQNCLF